MKITSMLGGAALALSICASAVAKEGGDQYPNGAENWFAGALPPAGDYFLNYFGYYTGELRNASGDKANVGGKTPSVDAWFDALRWVHVTDTKLFGADWGWHVIVPVVNQKIDFVPLGGSRSATGIGDVTINPIVLGWHLSPELHVTAGLDINLPTGRYDRNDLRTSIGANYWSFEPVLAVSWLRSDGWEASAKLMVNFKTKNTDTDYRSGDDVHVDYLVGKAFGPWGVGVSGYYLKQFTEDKLNGATVAAAPGVWGEGRKGQVFAAGPSIRYSGLGKTHLIAQWQHEMAVENRFGGDKFWLKAIVPF